MLSVRVLRPKNSREPHILSACPANLTLPQRVSGAPHSLEMTAPEEEGTWIVLVVEEKVSTERASVERPLRLVIYSGSSQNAERLQRLPCAVAEAHHALELT